MSNLRRYLELNWPSVIENDLGMGTTEDFAIVVMRDLDQKIGAKDAVISDLVEALKEAIEWDGADDEGVPAVWLDKAKAALAKAGEAAE